MIYVSTNKYIFIRTGLIEFKTPQNDVIQSVKDIDDIYTDAKGKQFYYKFEDGESATYGKTSKTSDKHLLKTKLLHGSE